MTRWACRIVEHVGRCDLAHAFAADARMGVVPQRLPPLSGDAGRVSSRSASGSRSPSRQPPRRWEPPRLSGRGPNGATRLFSSAFSLASLSVTTGYEPSPRLVGFPPARIALAPGLGDAPGLHSVDAEVQPESAAPPVAVASRRLHPCHEGSRKRSFTHVPSRGVSYLCITYRRIYHGTTRYDSAQEGACEHGQDTPYHSVDNKKTCGILLGRLGMNVRRSYCVT